MFFWILIKLRRDFLKNLKKRSLKINKFNNEKFFLQKQDKNNEHRKTTPSIFNKSGKAYSLVHNPKNLIFLNFCFLLYYFQLTDDVLFERD